MGTLYIDRKDINVRLDGNALAFYSGGKREGVVPINPLKRVIVIGSVTLESRVLQRLADENISVIFLSGKRMRFCGMLHGRLHNNGILRLRQYEKSLTWFAINTAKDIVRRKIIKQRDFLIEMREQRPDAGLKLASVIETLTGINKTLSGDVSMETLRGLEGGAGAAYFSALVTAFPPSLGFEKRNKRPPEDPVNAMLSLCYTLLHYEITREIEVIGLDPTIGFYHQFDYGRESLACDLIEPYRPDVDRFVYGLFRTRVLTSRDFSEDDERPGCYLKKKSRNRFYPLYEEWSKGIRTILNEETRTLARRLLNEKDPVPE